MKPVDKEQTIMKTYVEKFIAEESRTELDLQFPYYSDTEKDEDGDTVRNVVIYAPELEDSYVSTDVSMDIDEVIGILNSLKQRGANRVYISDHCDHHGYYFYGVHMEECENIERELTLEDMPKLKVLELLKLEYPQHIIHEVRFVKKNEYGFYNVHVDMQVKIPTFRDDGSFITIRHMKLSLPYPLEKYNLLTKDQQRKLAPF
jgi:hypothetical protein